MRTNIELDERALGQVQRLGRYATKKEAVNAALQDHARRLKRLRLLALRGKVAWESDLDALRARRR
ncbi:MAG: type II toxin-antitoxin system VapB family antitoxin [Nevskia sp.]|nr:type II toxin-antitoxin system VapB family antitoxin [Nevskia sp.]